MYLDEREVRAAAARWGEPRRESLRVDVTPDESAFIRGTQRHGRAHDLTFLIHDGPRIAVIAKHIYPGGVYRLPSGGAEPGESIPDAIHREAHEETGLRIEVERYLLRVAVRFEAPDPATSIDWTTHVFEAVRTGGRLEPVDTKEIRDAAWVTRQELLGPIRRRLVAWKVGGIQYRWRLHDATFAELARRDGEEERP
jgi:8-oxo-dGTP pyrophosphatase MutT (NUDIX family)